MRSYCHGLRPLLFAAALAPLVLASGCGPTSEAEPEEPIDPLGLWQGVINGALFEVDMSVGGGTDFLGLTIEDLQDEDLSVGEVVVLGTRVFGEKRRVGVATAQSDIGEVKLATFDSETGVLFGESTLAMVQREIGQIPFDPAMPEAFDPIGVYTGGVFISDDPGSLDIDGIGEMRLEIRRPPPTGLPAPEPFGDLRLDVVLDTAEGRIEVLDTPIRFPFNFLFEAPGLPAPVPIPVEDMYSTQDMGSGETPLGILGMDGTMAAARCFDDFCYLGLLRREPAPE